jgi:hypothetical protein
VGFVAIDLLAVLAWLRLLGPTGDSRPRLSLYDPPPPPAEAAR